MSGFPSADPINVDLSSRGGFADAPGNSYPDHASADSETIEHKPSTSAERLPITLQSSDISPEDENTLPNTDGGYGYTREIAARYKEEDDVARRAIFSRYSEDARREVENCEAKRKDPIQTHLDALHQSYRNVDPEYTVFAFGGTIPPKEVDAASLTLHVVSWRSLDEEKSRFDGQMRKQGKVAKRRKRACRGSKE